MGLQAPVLAQGQVIEREADVGAIGAALLGRVERAGGSAAQADLVAAEVAEADLGVAPFQAQLAIEHAVAHAHRAGGVAGIAAIHLVDLGLGVGRDGRVVAVGLGVLQVGGHLPGAPLAAMQGPGAAGLKAAHAGAHFGALDVLGVLGDQVDDTGVGVGTVHGRARAADDFDAGDVLQR